MRAITQATTTTGAQPWIPLDVAQAIFNVGVGVKLVGGTATYGIEVTVDDVFNPAVTPVAYPAPAPLAPGAAANQLGAIVIPVRAVRLNVTVIGGGTTVTATYLQGLEN